MDNGQLNFATTSYTSAQQLRTSHTAELVQRIEALRSEAQCSRSASELAPADCSHGGDGSLVNIPGAVDEQQQPEGITRSAAEGTDADAAAATCPGVAGKVTEAVAAGSNAAASTPEHNVKIYCYVHTVRRKGHAAISFEALLRLLPPHLCELLGVKSQSRHRSYIIGVFR